MPFAFETTTGELSILMLQFATSNWGGRRKRPLAFTDYGAIMAATVLNSPRAVEMSVYVVRAFVKLRQVLASNAELAGKLEALEKSVATLDAKTRRQFEEVYRAIRALMTPPAAKSRPIGFTAEIGSKR
ncbi:MAG: ORF6N domain-containing protein [Burkholderiales bacterium]